MNFPHIRSFDLNLARVFLALFDEGSVTRAGARLGLTQSAVSHALNRLRYVLGDELFVRGPGGMQPTARAAEIAPRIRQGLEELQAALEPVAFHPAESDRRFVIAAGTYSASVLLPEVIERIRREAPKVSVRVRPPYPAVAEELDSGRSDVVIGVFGRTPPRFDSEPLFRERLVWVLREGHPAGGGPLTLERLAGAPHLIVAAGDVDDLAQDSIVEQGLERRVLIEDGAMAEELAAHGLERIAPLTLPDMHSALAVAARSDLAAAVPSGLARMFAKALKLRIYEPPYASPVRDITMLWRRDKDGPALQWLRSVLREAGARFMETTDG
jgi:DNA-binding transcriptional LysR family regulator